MLGIAGVIVQNELIGAESERNNHLLEVPVEVFCELKDEAAITSTWILMGKFQEAMSFLMLLGMCTL